MNRIVKEHYPVEKLPADLREGIADGTLVRVTLVVEDLAVGTRLLDELDQKLDQALRDIRAGRGLTVDDVKTAIETHASKRSAQSA